MTQETTPTREDIIGALRVATFALETVVMLQGLQTLAPYAERARAMLDAVDAPQEQDA